MGAKDVTALIDDKADRAGILREIDGLLVRTRPNDLVILSIAGHGTQEPERVKGSEPDGMENVFLLAGFEPTAAGSQQRVLGKEFNHFIKQFELRGARVVFVADTCHGGGMAREVDPRGDEMSFRQVPSYRLTDDTLKPVTTPPMRSPPNSTSTAPTFWPRSTARPNRPRLRIPGRRRLARSAELCGRARLRGRRRRQCGRPRSRSRSCSPPSGRWSTSFQINARTSSR